MPQSQNQVEIITGTVRVIHRKKLVSVVMPLMNAGPVPAKNVMVTDAQFNAQKKTTLALPWYLGDISSVTREQTALVTFSTEGLSVGDSCRVDLWGTFEVGTEQHKFHLVRSVVIPELETRGPQLLDSRVTVSIHEKKEKGENRKIWSYTVWNDEPQESQQFVAAFQIRLAALIHVQKTPKGWTVMTDQRSFVLWHASESVASRIGPGKSLGGFEIEGESESSEGAVYSLNSWNQDEDQADMIGLGTILAPARQRL